MKTMFAALAFSLLLVGCSTQVDDYKETSPKFELDRYFDGKVIAWGMIQDYSDKVTRRFCVEMTGSWQDGEAGKTGVLDEFFYYDDGEQDRRIWKLNKSADGIYTGSAGDVNGEASGEAIGFAFNWKYNLEVSIDDSEYTFALDDWMYQLDEYRLMNKTAMKKFGVTVAEITIFFDKEQPLRSCKK
ncbi:DUF3833 domain-containing protein [Psychrosphaera haliotis]|uniref:DUF3833 family protein n=1 Tax=Psychrosphaera haliotis TaxID=555083 RepID=A0A6N8FFH7_9GAMM|nr:DUF3833 domain-containing protein [Psychrosphaera haliotis]MUH73422.1 DUF3833 family protein [Psychrosphaera haliotis]